MHLHDQEKEERGNLCTHIVTGDKKGLIHVLALSKGIRKGTVHKLTLSGDKRGIHVLTLSGEISMG